MVAVLVAATSVSPTGLEANGVLSAGVGFDSFSCWGFAMSLSGFEFSSRFGAFVLSNEVFPGFTLGTDDASLLAILDLIASWDWTIGFGCNTASGLFRLSFVCSFDVDV